jgi:isopropylmalate/homocitrate/citramalate synthase
MKNTPWNQEKWFTSPWNFADEVTKDFNFAKKIKFHDVTLRDGEQQAGLVFTKDQKVALADKMAELGMHRIEAGMPAVSPSDRDAIIEIVKRNQYKGAPEIFAFARCMREDVMRAVDCGVKGIVIEIPASEHIVKYAYKWDYEKAINLAIDATLCAKENGLYTVFFPIDGTRTDLPVFMNLIKRVADEGHMDALAIVDTFGGLAPSACAYLVREVKKFIDKPLELHFHDDFGVGAANTIAGLSAGAEIAHTSISGVGERAGNTSYEQVALTLLTMYNIDTGIKYDKIYELSQLMRRMTGMSIRPNAGIVGETVHQIESGIVADWFYNANEIAPLELSPYLYSLIGHPEAEVVLGKMSGIPNVNIFLDKLGIKCDDHDKKLKIVGMIKDKAIEQGCLLTETQFKEFVNEVLG